MFRLRVRSWVLCLGLAGAAGCAADGAADLAGGDGDDAGALQPDGTAGDGDSEPAHPPGAEDAGMPSDPDADSGRPPDDPRPIEGDAEPAFSGRVELDPYGVARFAWPGTSVSARFSGSELRVDLEDAGDNVFLVSVDGVPQAEKLAPGSGRHTVTLASGLAPGAHHVRLYKLTEPLLGETQFFGFDVPGGELLPYFAPRERRIEIIGDSITAGYGNEGTSATCSFRPDNENHYLSYGAMAARELSAELVTVAWSGKGVFSNRGSTVDTLVMPVLWRRTLPERAASDWDFARFRPHAVVVNLGTNDLSPDNPNQAPFADEYLRFIEEVRDTYPEAFILCTNGPLLSDFWPEGKMTLTRAREAIQGAVDALASRGDERVAYLEFAGVSGDEGYGCDYHPSLKTHARMAEELTKSLREHLGW